MQIHLIQSFTDVHHNLAAAREGRPNGTFLVITVEDIVINIQRDEAQRLCDALSKALTLWDDRVAAAMESEPADVAGVLAEQTT
jgi:hypothetical protein